MPPTFTAPRLHTRWLLPDAPREDVTRLADALGLHPLAALLLVRRGIVDPDAARRFLKPDLHDLHEPALLPGMDAAADRLKRAVRDGERMAVYGDYDVDGICGTALLVRLLRSVGADVRPWIPDRRTDGYGFNEAAVRHLAAEGVRVLVTVDHGSKAVDEVALAKSLGIDVVITDHHLVGDGPAPDAVALVNPQAPAADGTPAYPFPWLCGTGVAFKLGWALAQQLSGGTRVTGPLREQLTEALALVSLATVADVVPLRDENRVAVVFGAALLRRSPTPGIRALLEVSGLAGREPDAEDIGFKLAPRINAAGRMGDAGRALELLVTDDPARAAELAAELDTENTARRGIERAITEAARAAVPIDAAGAPPAGIVVAGDDWNVGVVGIVAARIAETFHRPTVVIGMDGDTGRGSARSVAGFHLERALAACGEHLLAHGGHAAAAGLEIARPRLEDFTRAFAAHAETHLPVADRVPALELDALVPLSDLDVALLRTLERLGPHGNGNPGPLLAAEGLRIAGKPRTMGRDRSHLTFHVRGATGAALRAVWFGAADRLDELRSAPDGELAVAFRPTINRFRGRAEVELMVRDARIGPAIDRDA